MKAFKYFLSIILFAFVLGGCAYNWIVEEDVIDPDDPDAAQVSFSTDIVPIFASKCIACHKTGGQRPDLTAENAYAALNSTRYINKTTPAESLIYTRPNPSNTDSHMKYSEAEAAKVLTWITQGAANN